MKKRLLVSTSMLAILLTAVPCFASDQKTAPREEKGSELKPVTKEGKILVSVKIPLLSSVGSDVAVAVVNNEPITLEDLRNAIADTHQKDMVESKDDLSATSKTKMDMVKLLGNLVNARLILQEANAVGLHDLPEIKSNLDNFSHVTLRRLLRDEITKTVTASDEEVEKVYQASVQEVKFTYVLFKSEKEAKRASDAIRRGESFDNVVAGALKAKTATGTEGGTFLKLIDLEPALVNEMSTIKAGEVSSVRRITKGGKTAFGFFRLEEKQTKESSEAKEQARQSVLENKKIEALRQYHNALYKKYTKVNGKLFTSLDYGPQGPGIEKLMKDQRIVAEIKGEEPILVAQLSESLENKLFHGVKDYDRNKFAPLKQQTLEELVQKKLFYTEALKRGLDKTAAYKSIMTEYERSVLFGAFIGNVLVPNVNVTEDEMRTYYRDHAGEYMTAKSLKIRSLVFGKKDDAVSALDRLKKGADFAWIKTNAEGQLSANTEDLLTFDENPVPIDSLEEGVRAAVSDARSDDFRLFESPQGDYYVLHVQQVIPPTQRPFEQVQADIRAIVFKSALSKSLEEWIQKLRKSADIKIYIAGSENNQ